MNCRRFLRIQMGVGPAFLGDRSRTYREGFEGFVFTWFNGEHVRISDGELHLVTG